MRGALVEEEGFRERVGLSINRAVRHPNGAVLMNGTQMQEVKVT
jgi:hypothetical protein